VPRSLSRKIFFFGEQRTRRRKKTFNLTSFTVETQEGTKNLLLDSLQLFSGIFQKSFADFSIFLPFKKKPIDDYTPISKRHTDIPMNGLQFFFCKYFYGF
jgi:hypothetical protein